MGALESLLTAGSAHELPVGSTSWSHQPTQSGSHTPPLVYELLHRIYELMSFFVLLCCYIMVFFPCHMDVYYYDFVNFYIKTVPQKMQPWLYMFFFFLLAWEEGWPKR